MLFLAPNEQCQSTEGKPSSVGTICSFKAHLESSHLKRSDGDGVWAGSGADGEPSVGVERRPLVCESQFRNWRQGSSLRVQGLRTWGPRQPSLPRLRREVSRDIFMFYVYFMFCFLPRELCSNTRALWLIQRTDRRYFYITWKGNPSSQMWFFVQLCSSWQDFNWLKGSHGLSAAAELLVCFTAIICHKGPVSASPLLNSRKECCKNGVLIIPKSSLGAPAYPTL